MNELMKLSMAACLLTTSSAWSMAADSGPMPSNDLASPATDMAAETPNGGPLSSDSLLSDAPPAAGSATFTFKGKTFSTTPCAPEDATCKLPVATTVAYGAKGSYAVRNLAAGTFVCNNKLFGDPVYGWVKACFVLAGTPSAAAAAPSPVAAVPGMAAGNAATPVAATPVAVPVAATPISATQNAAAASAKPLSAADATSPAQVEAARFLVQATYGPTESEIKSVAQTGPKAWMERQFATPPMDSHWAYVMDRKGPIGCTVCDANHNNAVMESFWMQAVQGPDQLRQRTVLALSEIFVVSTEGTSKGHLKDANAAYLDLLSRNAFGNYRTLLEQVALSPTMGSYLSHIKNLKEDPVTGRLPDENFAREIMQLFSLGLWELNSDGSRRKDASGNDIATYSQADVMGMAKVFTGWSWGNGNFEWGVVCDAAGCLFPFNQPMKMYPQYHSTSEKRIVRGVVIPANTSGEQSLKIALDTLFNHPNVGPFFGSLLIKRLVTSNPSPAYVSRVSAAFSDNGAGVRGDMKAVLKAVLLDPEARDPAKVADRNWGKLREPLVRYANFMRAFDVKSSSNKYRLWNLEDPVSSIGQNPLRAPSVFNWYRADYAPPGEVLSRGMVAPEFAITHETTTTGYTNFIVDVAARQTASYRDNVAKNWGPITDYLATDYAAELPLASNPAALVERLNLLLAAGRMSAATKQTVLDAINSIPLSATSANARVATAVALTMVSPDYIVQK
jgi:uncharacterized protein (DUF1800 family)